MKKITVKTKLCPDGFVEKLDDQKAELFVAESIQYDSWGKPERWVLHKDEPFSEAYDEADVLEEKVEEVAHSVVAGEGAEPSSLVKSQKWVKLKAEYTVEIEDITAQAAQEAINAEALAYLTSTDWMIIREVDAGVACPAEVKAERAAARARIVK